MHQPTLCSHIGTSRGLLHIESKSFGCAVVFPPSYFFAFRGFVVRQPQLGSCPLGVVINFEACVCVCVRAWETLETHPVLWSSPLVLASKPTHWEPQDQPRATGKRTRVMHVDAPSLPSTHTCTHTTHTHARTARLSINPKKHQFLSSNQFQNYQFLKKNIVNQLYLVLLQLHSE